VNTAKGLSHAAGSGGDWRWAERVWVFGWGSGLNFDDPFGLFDCDKKTGEGCSDEYKRLLKFDKPLQRPLVDPIAIASGMAAGAIVGALEGAASSEVSATAHGAMRMADPSRLGAKGVRDVVSNATRTFGQKDGARVFAQEVNGGFNVVVQGERGVVTTFKNLSQKSLDRLAKNYGWEPK
jgi:hypothetical protein